jgi:glycosyltransferase involved in cell wall biosynthesis
MFLRHDQQMAKRILLTTFTFPPNQDGVAMASANLARGLAERGYEVTVATAYQRDRIDAHSPQVTVVQFAIEDFANLRKESSGQAKEYVRFVRSFPCDIIICECWPSWSTEFAQRILSDHRAKKILVSHGFSAHLITFHRKPPFGLGVWLRQVPYAFAAPRTMRFFDHVVFLSERKDLLRFFDHTLAHWTGYQNHSSIPNGVWLEEFAPRDLSFRRIFKIETDHVVLNVANYSDRKNQLKALETFAECGPEDATLVFIGSAYNEYAEKLETRLKELRKYGFKSPVRILRGLGRKAICSAYQASSVFLLTAKAETQPIVLLEALANRLPFVSTDTGCVRELVGGIVANSKKQLAAALRRLLDDEAERRRLGQAGRILIEREYLWPAIIDRYTELIEGLSSMPAQAGAAGHK